MIVFIMVCLVVVGAFGAPQYGNIQDEDVENFVIDEKLKKAISDKVTFSKEAKVSKTNVAVDVDEEFSETKVSEAVGKTNLRAAAPVSCRTEYTTLWSTEYTETETQVCTTLYDNKCENLVKRKCVSVPREECTTVQDRQCSTVYNEVCVDEYRTEYDQYTETECTTEYKEDCEYRWEGAGYEKVWAPIPGTCVSNPYDTCVEVPKQKERQVAYPVCTKVPEEKCVSVPRQECRTVQEQKCTNQPYQTCTRVPRQSCDTVHKKVPTRVSRRAPKKVCDDDSGAGYSAAQGSGYSDQGSGYSGGQGSGSSVEISARSGADAIQFQEEE